MAKRFTVEAVFKAIDKFTAPVTRMQNRVQKFTRGTTAGLMRMERRLDRVARGMKTVGVVGVAALALLSVGMADVIKTGAQFEQTMVNAATRFQGEIREGSKAFKVMEDAAREAGRTTEFTSQQAASALNSMARAGFTVESSIKALPRIIDLATVAETDLATATDIATKSLGAFGLRSKDTQKQTESFARVIDVISLAANRGNTTIEDMFQAIQDGAGTARIANTDLETTAAIFATLADAGIEASKAGIGLKRLSLALAAPKGRAADIFRRLGIDLADKKTGQIRDVLDVMDDLNAATKKLGQQGRVTIIEEIFGKIGITSAIPLLEQIDHIRDLRKELKGAKGISTEWAGVMRNTVLGELKALNSAIESVKLEVFTLSKGPLKDLITDMKEWVRTNEKFIAQKVGAVFTAIFKNPDKIIFWAKAIGGVIVVMGTLITTVKVLTSVMTLFNIAMALNPMIIIVVSIIALIAAISSVVIWFEEWTEWVRNASGAFKVLLIVAGLILGPVGALIALIVLMITHWDELEAAFTEVFTEMFITLDKWGAKFTSVIDTIKDTLSGLWDGMKNGARAAFRTVLNIIDEARLKMLDAQALTTFNEGKLLRIGTEINAIEADIRNRNKAAESEATAPRIVTPEEQLASRLEEKRTISKTEVTIKDETGRAVLTGPAAGGLQLIPSGGFD